MSRDRRLAAILVADVVGYSRLMGADELGTLERLEGLRVGLIEPLVAAHGGRIVKLMGDGFLIEFRSVIQAVDCALRWQQQCPPAAGVPGTLRFRIGIHLGDVIADGDDLYGEGVNIAARLEGLAPPGGIVLSEDAYRHARGKVAASLRDLGTRELKNIAQPIRVFMAETGVETEGGPPGSPTIAADAGAPTLALWPFRHLGDPTRAFFTDGLTQTLAAALAHFGEFALITPGDAAAAPNSLSPPTYRLDGTVQLAGDHGRVTVQLTEVASGRHVWAETLDRDLADPFGAQDEIVGIIASTMGEGIFEESASALAGKRAEDFTPYDWQVKGAQHLHRIDATELLLARRAFERALEMKPDLAMAVIGLAWSHAFELLYAMPSSRADTFDYCVELTTGLLRQNERFDHAHRLLGRLYHVAGKHDEALAHSERAYRINPYNSDMVINYGLSLVYVGRSEDGIEQIERAIRINPYAPASCRVHLAQAYFLTGRYEHAVSTLRSLERPVGNSRLVLAASLAALDRAGEAESEVQQILASQPTMTLSTVARSLPFKEQRDRDAFLEALAKAGLPA